MNQLAVSSVVLIILSIVISAFANVKITPIAVENKSNLKSDMKVEEARGYQSPVMPEYYGGSYDRNRQNFVTSSYGTYGDTLSNYDRYGSTYLSGLDKYGSNYDRYGSQWNKDRTGLTYGTNPINPIDKVNMMPGGVYNPNYGSNPTYGTSYGNRYPYQGGPVNAPYPGLGGLGGLGSGLLPPELEAKTSLILPVAGAALLGIAAYTLFTNPGIAMGPMLGKRRKRSLFDDKLEQHLAYRAHHRKQVKRSVK